MWLLAAAVRDAIEAAQKSGLSPTAAQQVEYEARFGSAEVGASRVLVVAGDVAEITVAGVITQRPSFMAQMFGGGNVTYPEIIAALAEASTTPEVSRIEMVIDSPGGAFDGLFDALAAMESSTKPIRAVVRNQASSAAYALASKAGEIVASNKAARVGGIGVVGTFAVDDSMVDIASTNAPNKRPDVSTKDGVAVVREELDALHELFVDAIATGRGVTPETVNAEYGQGGVVLAGEALKRGMIDSISGASREPTQSAKVTTTTTASSGGVNPEIGNMDLDTLKAQHPAVYAAAVGMGTTIERDRVSGHLALGAASGQMEAAAKAVEDGTELTQGVQAKYQAAAINRNDQANRQNDEAAVAAATDGAEAGSPDSAAELVCAAVEQKLGIVGGAANV